MKQHIITIICLVLVILVHCNQSAAQAPKREVRAVWLTTIGGLDWPHTKAHDAESILRQQHELIEILDKLQAAKFNTILLQTRIRSTVIYPSAIEPWDDCLTGHAGKDPGYDPLKFAIDECHKRHLELHAWVVAFPGNSFRTAAALGRNALQKRVPQLCMKTNDFWMLNPGEPATTDYLARLCREIVDNYDVDGINLDYIRYPEKEVKYNDSRTYRKYGQGKNLADWRTDNVTRTVRAIYHTVKEAKPWVRLSCSPIGKYEDLSRYTSHGWNALRTANQDAQGWLKEGIMDMLIPMMYFEGDNFFPFAMDWIENANGRIIVPGLGAYMLPENERNWPLDIIQREDYVLRQMKANGQAYFRSRFVTENSKGLYEFLQKQFYTTPAITPALSWEPQQLPEPLQNPQISLLQKSTRLSWTPQQGVTYNVYRSCTYPVDTECPENILAYGLKNNILELSWIFPESLMPYFAVTSMNRYGSESKPVAFNTPTKASQNACTGLLTLNGNKLILPTKNREEFILITDAEERTVLTAPYTEEFNFSSLKPGFYTIRSLGQKANSHCLGKLIVTAQNNKLH